MVEEKSIFPYTYYNCVEELQQTQFPPHSAFYSELKGSNVTETEYNKAKSEYERRFALPEGHPDRMVNMRSWLEESH